MWIVYILRLNDNSLYTGITNNLEARIKKHNSGKGSKYVKTRLPATLVYKEDIGTKSEALVREFKIKKLSKIEKETLIKEKDHGERFPNSTIV